MKWLVVSQDSFDAWATETDPERDADLRIAVLSWVIKLVDGPPPRGIFDPFAEVWFAEVGSTEVRIRYVVLRELEVPTIVIREYL